MYPILRQSTKQCRAAAAAYLDLNKSFQYSRTQIQSHT